MTQECLTLCTNSRDHFPSLIHTSLRKIELISPIYPHQVQQWTRAKIKELLDRARSLGSVCNAAAPINYSLPPDVLLEVFGHLEPSFEQKGGLNFLHVCRLWRHLLLRSTAFWTKVVGVCRAPELLGPDGVALFRSFLQLTRNSPLTLTLHSRDPEVPRTLVSWASRIVSLTITLSPGGVDTVNTWLEQRGMPTLEHLAISHSASFGSETSTHPKLTLNGALFPRLRSLRHPIATLEVSSIDAQLRQLALFECSCMLCNVGHQIVLESLLFKMLQRCPSIHSLHLDTVRHLTPETKDNWTVELPALRHLRVVNRCSTAEFLDILVVPNTCVIELASTLVDAAIYHLLPQNSSA
ncbi:hypothetical protein C8T65DRAFT_746373 [Cerioporus squamosus]|nr:hypothetical protein C8T65DRAFT_746373 [Cerioporus squamosus]